MPLQAVDGGSILIVEDDESLAVLIRLVLEQDGHTDLRVVTDPREALPAFLESRPDLVILDLMMPHLDGIGVLRLLSPIVGSDDHQPVLVLSGDSRPESRERALAAGATEFVSKPFDNTELALRVRNLLKIRRLQRRLQEQNRVLEDRVHERTRELVLAQNETLIRLSRAAEFRDDATGRHTARVGDLAAVLAEHLGLDDDFVDSIRYAAALHDVGKIAVPDHILLKPSYLTFEERTIMQRHARAGCDIMEGSGYTVLQLASQIAYTHHERWDGFGYPRALAREEIPLVGRIVAVADAFDAMTNDRPYRKAWSVDAALIEIERCSGTQFDPTVAATMLEISDGLEVPAV